MLISYTHTHTHTHTHTQTISDATKRDISQRNLYARDETIR